MEIVRPRFVPDPGLSREEMEALQGEIADEAVFSDDLPVEPDRFCLDSDAESGSQTAGESPVVAGVDQAFLDGEAISAVVAMQDGEVIEAVHAVEPTEIPYIPGLLAFREGGPILAALRKLAVEPDLLLVDGSGRIHYHQAGLATHIGLLMDVPGVGVAKRLLCGEPASSLEPKLPAGSRVAIEADEEVDVQDGTPIGVAVQTRQFEDSDRYVNPVYVSPGHRISAETAADVVEACCAGYKLPEPIRRADAAADSVKQDGQSG